MHYRRAGTGPPVLLLHDAARSSRSLEATIHGLADRFTVMALDAPGHGLSDPPENDESSLEDYVERILGTLDALDLDPCPIYGVGLGACFALELARAKRGRATRLVLERLPLFSKEESAALVERFAPPFTPAIDGSHLVGVWSFQRDGRVYFPWYERTQDARLEHDLTAPDIWDEIQADVVDQLRVQPHYSIGCKLALRYDPLPALRSVNVPVTLVARGTDVLSSRLEAFSDKHRDSVRIVKLASTEATDGLAGLLGQAPHLPDSAPAVTVVGAVPGRMNRRYVSTRGGQLHVRQRLDQAGRPLVMFHFSPGSASTLEDLLNGMAAERPVYAPDTFGNGDSDKPDAATFPEHPSGSDYAPIFGDLLDDLGIHEVDLYGAHTGAMIASEVAIRFPDRVKNLILDGVVLDDPEAPNAAKKAVDITPRFDGGHLLTAWWEIRDATSWSPRYKRDSIHAFGGPAWPADLVHDFTLEFLKSGRTARLSYVAAFEYPASARLPLIRARTLVCASASDQLAENTNKVVELIPGAIGRTLPDDLVQRTAFLQAFLNGMDPKEYS